MNRNIILVLVAGLSLGAAGQFLAAQSNAYRDGHVALKDAVMQREFSGPESEAQERAYLRVVLPYAERMFTITNPRVGAGEVFYITDIWTDIYGMLYYMSSLTIHASPELHPHPTEVESWWWRQTTNSTHLETPLPFVRSLGLKVEGAAGHDPPTVILSGYYSTVQPVIENLTPVP